MISRGDVIKLLATKPQAYHANSFVAPSILWHLRLVGSATASRLHTLMGSTGTSYIVIVAKQLAAQGLVQISKPHAATLYSLTEAGLAEAVHVARDRVEAA